MEQEVTCSVWGPFCLVEPRVACPECSAFVHSVMGIRGPYWEGCQRAGRRRSYRTGASRDGAVNVSDAFFDLLRDETCSPWLHHLHDQDDLREHTRDLPAWIARLLKSVELKTDPEDGAWYFARPPARDAASHVAAALLGVSVRSVYRARRPRRRVSRWGPQ